MKAIRDTAVFERAAAVFVNGINAILEKHVPRAKESPFAKRWWTKELTLLRQDFTSKRNRVTTLRRRGECTILLREASYAARRSYLNEIDRQKKQHWIDFLDDPDNLWKAASYAKPAGAPIDVPELVANGRTYETDEDKAELLIATFFPTPPMPGGHEPVQAVGAASKQAIEWPLLTKEEVEKAVFRSNPDKASGPDEISFRVWREL
jgi:hypothetical protein